MWCSALSYLSGGRAGGIVVVEAKQKQDNEIGQFLVDDL